MANGKNNRNRNQRLQSSREKAELSSTAPVVSDRPSELPSENEKQQLIKEIIRRQSEEENQESILSQEQINSKGQEDFTQPVVSQRKVSPPPTTTAGEQLLPVIPEPYPFRPVSGGDSRDQCTPGAYNDVDGTTCSVCCYISTRGSASSNYSGPQIRMTKYWIDHAKAGPNCDGIENEDDNNCDDKYNYCEGTLNGSYMYWGDAQNPSGEGLFSALGKGVEWHCPYGACIGGECLGGSDHGDNCDDDNDCSSHITSFYSCCNPGSGGNCMVHDSGWKITDCINCIGEREEPWEYYDNNACNASGYNGGSGIIHRESDCQYGIDYCEGTCGGTGANNCYCDHLNEETGEWEIPCDTWCDMCGYCEGEYVPDKHIDDCSGGTVYNELEGKDVCPGDYCNFCVNPENESQCMCYSAYNSGWSYTNCANCADTYDTYLCNSCPLTSDGGPDTDKMTRDCFGICGGDAKKDCGGDCGGGAEEHTYYWDDDGDGLGCDPPKILCSSDISTSTGDPPCTGAGCWVEDPAPMPDCGCGCNQPCNDIDADGVLDCVDDCVGTLGCDGICNSGKIFDACNVCDGDDSSCRDCANVINGTATKDVCGTCNGNGASDWQCGPQGGGAPNWATATYWTQLSPNNQCWNYNLSPIDDTYPNFEDLDKCDCLGSPFNKCGKCGANDSECEYYCDTKLNLDQWYGLPFIYSVAVSPELETVEKAELDCNGYNYYEFNSGNPIYGIDYCPGALCQKPVYGKSPYWTWAENNLGIEPNSMYKVGCTDMAYAGAEAHNSPYRALCPEGVFSGGDEFLPAASDWPYTGCFDISDQQCCEGPDFWVTYSEAEIIPGSDDFTPWEIPCYAVLLCGGTFSCHDRQEYLVAPTEGDPTSFTLDCMGSEMTVPPANDIFGLPPFIQPCLWKATCQLGDSNGDGDFNVLDIVTLANCVLDGDCDDTPHGRCANDVNGDGSYNILDVVTVANCVLAQNCGN